MDFDEEIKQHLLWKSMIESLLGSQSKGFVPKSVVVEDHLCQLGQWLHSEKSAQYSSSEIFTQLVDAHKSFHKLAGEIMALCQAGEEEEAEKRIPVFNQLSEDVVSYLGQMKALK